jgi:Translation elongation factor EF-1beta
MGDMIVVIKVFPEDDRVDLESLSTEIEKILPEKVRLEKKEKEPLAFGLNSLLLYLIMPEDIELSMDQLEEK